MINVAFCFSGAIRGDYKKCISDIKSNISDELNCFFFLHSWNKHYEWQGWTWIDQPIYRFFGSEYSSLISVPFCNRSHLLKNFPSFCEKMSIDRIHNLDVKDLESLGLNQFYLEDETTFNEFINDSFVIDLKNINDSIKIKNTLKMFYGIKKSFLIMQEYEQKNSIQFDYVVRVRPDIAFYKKIDKKLLYTIKDKDVLIEFNPPGLSDQLFISKPKVMKQIVEIWDSFLEKKNGSPFDFFPPNTSNHLLLLLWMIKNDINITKLLVKRDIYAATKSFISTFKDQILHDYKNLEQKNPNIAKNYTNFVNKVCFS